MVNQNPENLNDSPTIIAVNESGKKLSVITDEGFFEMLRQLFGYKIQGVSVFKPQKQYPAVLSLNPENKALIIPMPVPALSIIPYTLGYLFPDKLVKRIFIDGKIVWESKLLRQNPKERISIYKTGDIKIEFVDIPEIREIIKRNREGFKKLGLNFIMDEIDKDSPGTK